MRLFLYLVSIVLGSIGYSFLYYVNWHIGIGVALVLLGTQFFFMAGATDG